MNLLVDISVLTDDLAARALSGVWLQVYLESSGELVTSVLSDAAGVVHLLLPAGVYQLRMYKHGVSFRMPVRLELAASGTFNVYGTALTGGESRDSRLCRASGIFRDSSGQGIEGIELSFRPQFVAAVIDNSAFLDTEVRTRTDKRGYAEVELVRCAMYDVRLKAPSLAGGLLIVRVPDAPLTCLPSLLFPWVSSVQFDRPGPWTLSVGEQMVLTPTVWDSAGAPLQGAAPSDVRWESSDPRVLGVTADATTLTLRGLSQGSAQLLATGVRHGLVVIPDLPVAGAPVAVTVQ